ISCHLGRLELAPLAVFGELVAERADADAEEPRRLRAVVPGALQRVDDEPPFHLPDGEAGEAAHTDPERLRLAVDEVLVAELRAAGEKRRPLERVLELAHVARPGPRPERFPRLGRERQPASAAEAGEE